jgi:hypothetical protein
MAFHRRRKHARDHCNDAPAAAADEAAKPTRCTAKTKAGSRCKRNATAGADVCSSHD